jgi:hypothetical protein
VPDFVDDAAGKLIPYGLYDLGRNAGWLNMGVDDDAPDVAAASVARWWRHMGSRAYPAAKELLVAADCGGSAQSRRWKVALQRFADWSGLAIGVSHFPRGTSKWSRIEHRLLCHVTEICRGRPPVDHETVVNLIGSVRTPSAPLVNGKLATISCRIGAAPPDAEPDDLLITTEDFHGEWNYTLHPRRGGHPWTNSF